MHLIKQDINSVHSQVGDRLRNCGESRQRPSHCRRGTDGELVYAHDIWGKEYHYLNWYCDKSEDEERADYLQRSYDKAKEGIMEARKVADRLGKKCYIVLVTEYIHLT